jgi:predicted 3-demethylubiquinone-9 3-methyltransferase (glyoxalase superfamily)
VRTACKDACAPRHLTNLPEKKILKVSIPALHSNDRVENLSDETTNQGDEMQKITPFLWFDNNAEEAANFYVSLFENSKVARVSRYEGTPTGTVTTVDFELAGQEFAALDGGPLFKFTPAVSFFVSCDTRQEIDALWDKLSDGGSVLMELAEYTFSERFGWVADKFGLSWQLILASPTQKIAPCLMFVGEQNGKAEEAMSFYTSLFANSSVDRIEKYGAAEGNTEGAVKHGVFSLAGQRFIAMDGGTGHGFTFNEATSLVVNCENQEEVDYFWKKFTDDGGQESQCGWLKDKYGLSWQIVPTALFDMLQDRDREKAASVMNAMLQMRKIDIPTLRRAYDGQV